MLVLFIFIFSLLFDKSIPPIAGQEIESDNESSKNYTEFEKVVLFGVDPILGRFGVENSDRLKPKVLSSSPGCPRPFKGQPWVYYGDPVRCHLTGVRWGCPENMKLFGQTTSPFGYCDCDCEEYRKDRVNSPQLYCRGLTEKKVPRTLVYVLEWKSCFAVFDQARCPEGEWLVLGDDPKEGPFCEARKCPPLSESRTDFFKCSFSYFDYKTGECRKAQDRCELEDNIANNFGISGSGTGSKNGRYNKYQVGENDWIPSCSKGTSIAGAECEGGRSVGNVIENKCPPGERFSNVLGFCVYRGSNGGDFG